PHATRSLTVKKMPVPSLTIRTEDIMQSPIGSLQMVSMSPHALCVIHRPAINLSPSRSSLGTCASAAPLKIAKRKTNTRFVIAPPIIYKTRIYLFRMDYFHPFGGLPQSLCKQTIVPMRYRQNTLFLGFVTHVYYNTEMILTFFHRRPLRSVLAVCCLLIMSGCGDQK